MFSNPEDKRLSANRLLLGLLWLHVPLNAVALWAISADWRGLTALTALVAGLATLMWRLSGVAVAVRVFIAVALVVEISLLVAGFRGHPWQLDLHMYYFAALAITAVYCDARVVIAAAGAIAAHHLVLNFLVPAAIYPGGADFERVVLHAAVVVLESAALIWLSAGVVRMFTSVDEASRMADEARQRAEAANAAAEAAHDAERRATADQRFVTRSVRSRIAW